MRGRLLWTCCLRLVEHLLPGQDRCSSASLPPGPGHKAGRSPPSLKAGLVVESGDRLQQGCGVNLGLQGLPPAVPSVWAAAASSRPSWQQPGSQCPSGKEERCVEGPIGSTAPSLRSEKAGRRKEGRVISREWSCHPCPWTSEFDFSGKNPLLPTVSRTCSPPTHSPLLRGLLLNILSAIHPLAWRPVLGSLLWPSQHLGEAPQVPRGVEERCSGERATCKAACRGQALGRVEGPREVSLGPPDWGRWLSGQESPCCYGLAGGALEPRCLFTALINVCTYEVSRSSIL